MSNEPKSEVKLDVKASHELRTWKHTAPMLGCRFDPSGRYVFASSMDQSIQRWDLQEDKHTSYVGHESWLRGIGFSPDGQQVYTGGYDGKLCFWENTPGDGEQPVKPRQEIEAHQGWIRWLAVHPEGKWLATAGNDLAIRLWSPSTGELVKTLEGHEKHIYSLFFHPNGELLLSGDLAGVVKEWNLETGELVRSFDAKPLHSYNGGQGVDYGGVRCISLSPDGQKIAFGGLHKATNPFAGVQEPLVLVFEYAAAKQIRTHEATDVPRGIVWRLISESDGTLIGGIGGNEGWITFWNQDKMESFKLKMPSPVLDLDRHPTAPELVTAHHDGGVRITRMTAKA